jgi:hypothetical protein
MCNLCGQNCGRGGALNKHLSKHGISYAVYKKCFYEGARIITNTWAVSGKTNQNKKVMIHVLVRRVVGEPGPRGVSK